MIVSVLPRLASLLLVLANALATDHSSVTTHLSAFAERRGDMAVWQVCNIRPGISATFTPNPSYGLPDRHGTIADRAVLALHVSSAVPPGSYRLVFLSYSYIYGSLGPTLIVEYLPRLHVLFDHSIRFPAFQNWPGLDANDPHAVIPQAPCTQLPSTNL